MNEDVNMKKITLEDVLNNEDDFLLAMKEVGTVGSVCRHIHAADDQERDKSDRIFRGLQVQDKEDDWREKGILFLNQSIRQNQEANYREQSRM